MINKDDLIENNGKIIKYYMDNNWYISSLAINISNSNYIRLGHPMHQKTGYISCGSSHMSVEDALLKIEEIKVPRQKDIDNWIYKYNEFHESIISDKGYDSCAEDVSFLVLNTNINNWVI